MSSTEVFEVFNKTILSLQLKYLKSSIEVFEISFNYYSHKSPHLNWWMSSTDVFDVFNGSMQSLQLKYLQSSIEVFKISFHNYSDKSLYFN